MYRNPTFDYENDHANTVMLIGDVRRVMYIGITVVVVFSLILMLSGGIEAGFNLMLIVGVPLLLLASAGEALRLWTRRGAGRHSAHVPTIFDQLAMFDEVANSPDGHHRHPHPR
jgi:protein-S-isoprenylcysteine O-methyltransferase Ste14